MKTKLFISVSVWLLFFSACKKEDQVSCRTCNSPATASFELCREPNGNASVNGQDTGTPYDVYFAGFEETGVECK